MPIRVRTQTNTLRTLPPDTRFVEIVDDRQRLLAVAYADAQGLEQVLTDDSPLFARYCRMFGLIPARPRTLPAQFEEPPA